MMDLWLYKTLLRGYMKKRATRLFASSPPVEEEAPKGKGQGTSDSTKALYAEFFEEMKGKKVPNSKPGGEDIAIKTLSNYAQDDPKAKDQFDKIFSKWKEDKQKKEKKEKAKLPADKQEEHETEIKERGGKVSTTSLKNMRDQGGGGNWLKDYNDDDIDRMVSDFHSDSVDKNTGKKVSRNPDTTRELQGFVSGQRREILDEAKKDVQGVKKAMKNGDKEKAMEHLEALVTSRKRAIENRPHVFKNDNMKKFQQSSSSYLKKLRRTIS